MSRRQIARQVGRAHSTVSRELARNRSPQTTRYTPNVAQRLADGRLVRPHTSKLADTPALRGRIEPGLARRWSPEQISRGLKQTAPERPELHVAHETIDQALYVQGRGALRRELRSGLRTGRALRKRRGEHRRSRFATPPILI
ncbi:MAG: helix-turn-helix domain-containing protein, partial [Chloroflexota bacterium]|nr:helix-turn-helix domain-containing protein [Chloroflexota bacterium]